MVLHPQDITEADKELIREVSKYGSAQIFSHYVLSKSTVKE
ncbi:hypothetical protein [Salipaludibacillus sp. CF4.18]